MACSLRIALILTSALMPGAVRMSQSLISSYENFRRDFGVERDSDNSSDYWTRAALFEKRREEVRRHNELPDMGWSAALNKFADYTDAEFHGMLGHRLSQRSWVAESVFEQAAPSVEQAPLSVDWRQKLHSSPRVKEQGACGSCWAVAATSAIETRAELLGHAQELSYEQLVDCVENPDECGGTGGCKGATAELAFEYVSKHGIALKKNYQGYQSRGNGKCRPPAHVSVTAQGFMRLPVNQVEFLLAAVAREGPLVVSVDGSRWGFYGSGIFHGCDKDAVINHAVLCMGYGTDHSDYWLIQNSWGTTWGEGGYIRLLRHKKSGSYCGVDHFPQEGVGCKGGKPTMKVCGMCGVLSDSAYPTGVGITKKA